MKAPLIAFVAAVISLLLSTLSVQQPIKKPAHITCRITSVDSYGVAVLACQDDKTDERFTLGIPEDSRPGHAGQHWHPGHVFRAGRLSDGTVVIACRVSQDCHPADQACLQTPLPVNRTCDFHDE